MALVPKKTYSRRENELFDCSEKEKENVDPFDALLASPLKHDVQFQPLGFWGKKVRDVESKKKKEVKCGLYEANDPDEFNVSWRKPKPRTVQPKCKLSKLDDRRKNHSTSYSFTKKTKQQILPNEIMKFAKDIIKYKDYSPENNNEILNFFCKNCNSFKCKNRQCIYGNYIKSSESPNKTLQPVKFKDNNIHVNSLEFGMSRYKSSAELLKNTNETLINKHSDDSINKMVHFNENTEETVHCNEDMEETFVNYNERLEETLVYYNESTEETVHCNEDMEETFVNYNERLEETFVNYNESTEETLVNYNESTEETLVNYNESLEESSVLFSKHWDRFKYVTIRRHINFPKYLSYDSSSVSGNFNVSKTTPVWSGNEDNEIISPVSLNACEDNSIQAELSGNTYGSVDSSLCSNESYYPEDSVSQVDGDESATVLESLGVRFSSDSTFKYFSNSELEDIIEELLEKESADMIAETSATSDDILSEQETIIKISPGTQEKISLHAAAVADSEAENDVCLGSSPNAVSLLTSGISDLSLSQVAEVVNGETEKLVNVQNSNYKDKGDNNSDLRNVAIKRGGFINEKSDSRVMDRQRCANLKEALDDSEFDQPFELSCIPDRMSIDWNKSILFGNPVFESTRVFDMGPMDGEKPQKRSNCREKMQCILEETPSQLDHGYALKPGKQWIRSMSVLKRVQSGNLTGGVLESTRITGRKFESFVEDVLKMQNEKSTFFTKATDITLPNKTSDRLRSDGTFLGCRSPREDESEELDSSVFSKTVSHKADLGTSLLHHTVKVVQFEDSTSAFRSALGLDSNRSIIQASNCGVDSNRQKSEISARDFLLIQCGQEDVLPFKEYFNEKTLPDCRKIGEGVYGEVFMCSDTVIKIIPIEGSDMVNGAPQKTFEEIISEVVIALQLSNLREGNWNRTDGFSEMKRCWCVKGKYPEYLLKLWNAYDQSGSGSENDSPVMFKDDQLYIILELANGGKDLESFVFSSSLQTLSVFIQIAFSLAIAENAFQFEHRDLHWGNVLISKTNDKFTSFILDNVEYKIPTKGVKVCIIDFTLSRINHNGCCIFNDLASDPELFTAHGDYQFSIYRMMLTELENDWSRFNPKTNVFWLHYLVDKMIKMVRYKIRNSKVHKKHMKDLNNLESIVLDYKDSTSFVLSKTLNDVLSTL